MSPEDEKVVNFLRQYRPQLSPSETDREKQLMLIIAQEAKVRQKRQIPLFGVITSFTALFMLIFASYRWFNPHPQITNVSDEELEAFLVESWGNTIEEPILLPTVYNSAWMTLNEPYLNYSTYNP
jgi:hypothetical protein